MCRLTESDTYIIFLTEKQRAWSVLKRASRIFGFCGPGPGMFICDYVSSIILRGHGSEISVGCKKITLGGGGKFSAAGGLGVSRFFFQI